MFGLCDAFKWNHLPNKGGIYDQNPEILDMFQYIFNEREKVERRKAAEEKRKNDPRSRGFKGASRGGY